MVKISPLRVKVAHRYLPAKIMSVQHIAALDMASIFTHNEYAYNSVQSLRDKINPIINFILWHC